MGISNIGFAFAERPDSGNQAHVLTVDAGQIDASSKRIAWKTGTDTAAKWSVAMNYSGILAADPTSQEYAATSQTVYATVDKAAMTITQVDGGYEWSCDWNVCGIVADLFPGADLDFATRKFDFLTVSIGVKPLKADGTQITSRVWGTCTVSALPKCVATFARLTKNGITVDCTVTDGFNSDVKLYARYLLYRVAGGGTVDCTERDIEVSFNGTSAAFPYSVLTNVPSTAYVVASLVALPGYMTYGAAGPYYKQGQEVEMMDVATAYLAPPTVTRAADGAISVAVPFNHLHGNMATEFSFIVGDGSMPGDRGTSTIPSTVTLQTPPMGAFTLKLMAWNDDGTAPPMDVQISNDCNFVDFCQVGSDFHVPIKYDIDLSISAQPVSEEVRFLGRSRKSVAHGPGMDVSGVVSGSFMSVGANAQSESDFYTLASGALQVLRLPDGRRFKVAPSEVTVTSKSAPGVGFKGVSVSFSEVS